VIAFAVLDSRRLLSIELHKFDLRTPDDIPLAFEMSHSSIVCAHQSGPLKSLTILASFCQTYNLYVTKSKLATVMGRTLQVPAPQKSFTIPASFADRNYTLCK
jgi:hypothetical protein